MKLLLTSTGLANDSIINECKKLLGVNDLADITMAFVPTASNFESDSKDWVIDDLTKLKNLGFDIDMLIYRLCQKRCI